MKIILYLVREFTNSNIPIWFKYFYFNISHCLISIVQYLVPFKWIRFAQSFFDKFSKNQSSLDRFIALGTLCILNVMNIVFQSFKNERRELSLNSVYSYLLRWAHLARFFSTSLVTQLGLLKLQDSMSSINYLLSRLSSCLFCHITNQ